jgi:hypothetical protein
MKRGKVDILIKQPGPKPGSLKAIPQHEAIAMGYKSPDTPRRTEINQKNTETGSIKVPGLTSSARGKR